MFTLVCYFSFSPVFRFPIFFLSIFVFNGCLVASLPLFPSHPDLLLCLRGYEISLLLLICFRVPFACVYSISSASYCSPMFTFLFSYYSIYWMFKLVCYFNFYPVFMFPIVCLFIFAFYSWLFACLLSFLPFLYLFICFSVYKISFTLLKAKNPFYCTNELQVLSQVEVLQHSRVYVYILGVNGC